MNKICVYVVSFGENYKDTIRETSYLRWQIGHRLLINVVYPHWRQHQDIVDEDQ